MALTEENLHTTWKWLLTKTPLFIIISSFIFLYFNFDSLKNLNILYYYGLYLIVFLLKFIKEFNETKSSGAMNLNKIYHIGLDLVLSSGGVIIHMFTQIKNPAGVGIFVIILVGLLLFAAFIESINYEKNIYLKNIGNFFIIFAVFFMTYYSFVRLKNSELFNKTEDNEQFMYSFQVGIPYKDLSLEKHIGSNKMSNKKLLFSKIISANDEKTAKTLVLESFQSEIYSKPLFALESMEKNFIEIDSSMIFIKKL